MIRADLKCLISSHNQSCLAILLMLEESDITGTALLPLIAVSNKLEELRPHLESLLLELLVGLDLDFLGEADNRLEVNVF
jgi:hypothetical protein